MKLLAIATLPMFFVACSSGPYPAPANAVLSDVEGYTLVPSSAHASQDGFGTLLFGDIMVYDQETMDPMNNIEIEVMSNWSGIYVLPQSAIKLVDAPSAPDDVLAGTASPAEYCDTDNDGNIDYAAEEWCSWWWDTETSQFYQFGGDYAMTPSNYQPTYMRTGTDSRGVCRFYLFVDSLPYDEDATAFSGSSFWISIGVDSLVGEIDVEN